VASKVTAPQFVGRKICRDDAGSSKHWSKRDKFYYTNEGIKKEIIPLQDQDKFIADLYQDEKHGLTSAGKFYKYIESNYTGISNAKVNQVLERIPVYQQFKAAKHICWRTSACDTQAGPQLVMSGAIIVR